MKRLAYPASKNFPYVSIIVVYALYVGVFASYHERLGPETSALAIFPVAAAGWYFGIAGGILAAILSILPHLAISIAEPGSRMHLFENPGAFVGTFVLIAVGLLIGRLGTVTRERREAITRLESMEREHQSHTDFLELLHGITATALQADNLESTLEILMERIGRLFHADHTFFSLWDASGCRTIPTAAYGSLRELYPTIQFEPGERTLTASIMDAGSPIAIDDIANSAYMSPRVAALFPCRSMLGIPLIVQERSLGALLLGYDQARSFLENDLLRAQLIAEPIARVLLKSLRLEEERKRVRQLTALHDIALIAIEVDNVDELISRVTDVIGQTLFTDNFGILLLDEESEKLRVHPSYRFASQEQYRPIEIPLDLGVTGQVARTGTAQRLGNTRGVGGYLNVDEATVSELCVPIKFKERILGVVNAESARRDAFTDDDERLLITLAGQVATAMEQIHRAQAERKWLDQLAHSNDLIYALSQITTHIERAFGTNEILQNLGVELSKLKLSCIMAVHGREKDVFRLNYTSLKPDLLAIVENGLGYPLTEHSFSRQSLRPEYLRHPAMLSDPVDEIQMLFTDIRRQGITKVLKALGIDSLAEPMRLPLTFEENLLGVLWIWGEGLTRADLPVMSIFAKQVGISLERARLFQEVQSLALTDPLTGLHNRRSLFELGRVEFSRAHRMDRDFSCMMLDLDHFKKINDTYGHPIGDQVLKEFAHRCKCSVREIDLVGRYGGEELMILLPETNRNMAMQVADRLRASIAATPIKIGDYEIPLTVSIGVATRDENTTHLETLIARADQAMYIAKHKGRNRVALSK